MTSTPCYFDGIQLDSYAWNIETMTGRRTAPKPRVAEIEIPGRSGHVAEFDGTYDAGQIILRMWVLGCDEYGDVPSGSSARKEFDANVDMLCQIFAGNPRGTRVYQETMGDGSVRCADCYVSDVITPEMFGPNSANFAIALTIPDSFKYENSDVTQSISSVMTAGTHALSSFAGATAPLNPIRCLVTGPITNPQITDDRSTRWIQYTGTVAAGDNWLFDTSTRVSRKGTGLTLASPDSSGSDILVSTTFNSRYRMLELAPGITSGVIVPHFTITGSSTTGSTAFAIKARRKFLS
jgi:hypothetical protein